MTAKTTVTSMRVQNRRVRSLALVIVAMLLAVVSTGCLTGDVNVKVNKDGSGSVEIVIFPTEELQTLLVAANAIPIAEDAVSQVRDSSFEKINEDGRLGYKVKLPFDDYQELGRTLVNGTIVGDNPVRLFTTFELTEINDEWRLNAILAPEMLSDALKADPSTQELIDSAGVVPLNSDLRLTISLPGKITRTNGTQTGSGSAQWALKTNTDATLQMVTVPKPLLTDTQKIFLGAGLAVVVGIFLLVWGSPRSWGKGAERKERRRTKKLTFAGPSGKGAGWQNQGPVAHAPEGTVPRSGPMPPRAIPTLGTPSMTGSPLKLEQRLPNGELAPVGPPVAPDFNPHAPNPFAPHRPGAPLQSQPGDAPAGASDPPVEPAPAPVAPAASAPVAPVDAPTGARDPVAPAAPQEVTPEQTAARHEELYHDPANELSGLGVKAGDAGHFDLAPVSSSPVVEEIQPVSDERTGARADEPAEGQSVPAASNPDQESSTGLPADKAPWWFESQTGQSPTNHPPASQSSAADAQPDFEPVIPEPAAARAAQPGPEPAWASTGESDGPDASRSPFSTGGAIAEDDQETASSHYVAAGGGFFDYVEDDGAAEADESAEADEVAEPLVATMGNASGADGADPGGEHANLSGATGSTSGGGATDAAAHEAEQSQHHSESEAADFAGTDTDSTLSSEVPIGATDSFSSGTSSAVSDDRPSWSPPETSVFDDDPADYPSIDGSGGLDLDLSTPVDEEPIEYPSIDGGGGLDIDLEADSDIPPDWYPDPDDPERFRWWDGVEWTDFVSDSGS